MLPRLCPTQKEAFGWYDDCMLRYANRTLLGISEEQPSLPLFNLDNVTDNVNQFTQVLGTLFNNLRNEAASGDSQLKFATGNDSYSSFGNVYALAQCSPDLSYRNCFNCLGDFINMLPSCCSNRIGAQVIGPSCKIRYENYLFYTNNNMPSPSPPSPPPLRASSPPPPPGNGSNTTLIAVLVVVPTVVSIVLAVIFIYLCRRRKARKKFNSSMASSSVHQHDTDESRSLVHSLALPVPSHPAFVSTTANIDINTDVSKERSLGSLSENGDSITSFYPR
ncbi:hypothetical protein SOVF_104860 [Spinacia oleracea]|nr:hypothetical protein SOVF_104860 [Spinacia oleracea]